jgi:dUTP pyrophosphatase
MKTGSKILVVKDYMMEIKIAKIYPDSKLPTRKHDGDAGIDLYFYINSDIPLPIFPGNVYIAYTGVKIEIPKGFFGWITNKSRNDFIIGAGIVDSSFAGEILVKIINVTNKNIIINKGDAIAQLLIIPVEIPGFLEVAIKEIHKIPTDRGIEGGICSQLEMKI